MVIRLHEIEFIVLLFVLHADLMEQYNQAGTPYTV